MANIKWGMFVVDGRGKVGGHVLTKTRSGATVRTKVTPANPQTSYQGLARSIFGSISTAWRDLSESNRASWQGAVDSFTKTNAFGDSYSPSGKNLFTGLNASLLNIDQPMITTAPAPIAVPPVVASAVTVDVSPVIGSSAIRFTFSTPDPDASFTTVIEATQSLSPGKYNFSGAYRKFTSFPGDTPPTFSNMYDYYVAKFGVPVVGSKISFRMRAVSNETGQSGVWASIDTIVTEA